jgi:hypothetical protein
MILEIMVAGGIAGVVSNVTGYLITGRLFHRFQARTPGTWRATESWAHYLYATGVRIAACIAMAFLYHVLGPMFPATGNGSIVSGLEFGAVLWAVTILPAIIEVSLFVNWHRGFVFGLLLDWLVVCVLACAAASVAM